MAAEAKAGREDRRRARTRTALLSAGLTLFATRPVDAVTIDDIVLAADVAKGSFYNHFPDKDAFAREIAAQVRGAVEAVVAHVNAGVADPAERVARALCIFTRQAADNPERVRAMLRLFPGAALPDAPMNGGVRADIQDGLTAGRFRDLPLEAGVLMAAGVVQIAVARTLEPGAAGGAEGLARGLAFGLLRGLGLDGEAAGRIAARAASDIFNGKA